MEFPGVLKKEHVEIPGGLLKKEWNFQMGVQEKIMWNFYASWFLTLEFSRGVTQFCRISRGASLEFLRVK